MSIGSFFSNICGFGPYQGRVSDYQTSVVEQNRRLSSQYQRNSVFDTHRDFAGGLNIPNGFDTLVVDMENRFIRRSRIGKITLKAAA